jgi:hypothetical protein
MRASGIGWSRIANRSVLIFLLTSAVNVIVLALTGLGLTAGIGVSSAFRFRRRPPQTRCSAELATVGSTAS